MACNNIQRQWNEYLERVIAPAATPEQVIYSKRLFYAGALAILFLLTGEEKEQTEIKPEMIDELITEMEEYSAGLVKGTN